MLSLESKCNEEKSDLKEQLNKNEIDEKTYQKRLKDLTATYTQEIERLEEENIKIGEKSDEKLREMQIEMEKINGESRKSIQASIDSIYLKINEVQEENAKLQLQIQRQQEELNRQRNRSTCLLI